jgi:hypothetical protein
VLPLLVVPGAVLPLPIWLAVEPVPVVPAPPLVVPAGLVALVPPTLLPVMGLIGWLGAAAPEPVVPSPPALPAWFGVVPPAPSDPAPLVPGAPLPGAPNPGPPPVD